MGKFQITYEWLLEHLRRAEGAASVEMSGDEIRAVLRAAWKGMGYTPELRAEIFDYLPSENPNWVRFQKRQQAYEEHAKQARSKLRVVSDDDPKE